MTANHKIANQHQNRPVFFGKPFIADRLHPCSDDDFVGKLRDEFLRQDRKNLVRLIRRRYEWMNAYIKEGSKGIEVGCGPGVAKLFIKSDGFGITDYLDFPWVDERVDALNMTYPDSSFDYIIASNMIHHVASPAEFFANCSRTLKSRGLLIVQDVSASLIFRILLVAFIRHEGYDYDVDVFDGDTACIDGDDPWLANNAIPNLLFDDMSVFEARFPFKALRNKRTECFSWIATGGVGSVSGNIDLPEFILEFIDLVDKAAIYLAPKIFAMQQQVVLVNNKKGPV